MEPTAPRDRSGAKKLLRYAPFLGIIVAVVLVWAVFGRGDDDGSSNQDTTGPSGGPVVFSADNKDSVEWGPDCDTTRGTVAVPFTYAPPCVEPFTGDNGGETAQGVTDDTITIALYQAQPDILEQTFFQQSGSDESLNSELDTVKQYVEFFEAHYETYGRHVEIVPVKATGPPDDETAARADAIKVATEVQGVRVVGRPEPDPGVRGRAVGPRGPVRRRLPARGDGRVREGEQEPRLADLPVDRAARRPLVPVHRPPAGRPAGRVRRRPGAAGHRSAGSAWCASTRASPAWTRPASSS